jgi:N-acetyl-beta-hexosaminidase
METKKRYKVLSALLDEFSALFPDGFLHVGGDEFQMACWNASSDVTAYARLRGVFD